MPLDDLTMNCFEGLTYRKRGLTTIDGLNEGACSVEHNSERWYIQSGSKVENKTDIDEVVAYRASDESKFTVGWKLPEGLTCEHCVVMWTWWSAQHCVYSDCDPAICGDYAKGLNTIVRPNEVDPSPECQSLTPPFGQAPQVSTNTTIWHIAFSASRQTVCAALCKGECTHATIIFVMINTVTSAPATVYGLACTIIYKKGIACTFGSAFVVTLKTHTHTHISPVPGVPFCMFHAVHNSTSSDSGIQ